MLFLLFATLLAFGSPAHAQQLTKIPRIGYLNATSPSTSPARNEAVSSKNRGVELGSASSSFN